MLYRAVETRQYQALGGAEAMDVIQAFREKYGNQGLQKCTAENSTQDLSERAGCLDQYVLYIPGRHVDGHLVYREYLIWYHLAHGIENLGLTLTVDTVGRYIELKASMWIQSIPSGSQAEGVEAIKSKL